MMRHGVTVYLTPGNLSGDRDFFMEEEYLHFWWCNEKPYYNIQKPKMQYLKELESFDLNTPTHSEVCNKSDGHITAKARVP